MRKFFCSTPDCHPTLFGSVRKRFSLQAGAGESLRSFDVPEWRITAFDAVVEAVGKRETWEASVQLVGKGGVVNLFGGCPSGTSVAFHASPIHYSGLTLLASFHHTPRTIRRALELIEQGVIRADDFVEGECP